MALIIPDHHGQPYPCTPATDPHWFDERGMTVEALNRIFGGRIGHRLLLPPVEIGGVQYAHLLISQDGRLRGLPANHEASVLLSRQRSASLVVAGPAVLLTAAEHR